jgi:hypothetical protein
VAFFLFLGDNPVRHFNVIGFAILASCLLTGCITVNDAGAGHTSKAVKTVVMNKNDFLLPAADLESTVASLAQPANAFMLASGIVVKPSETRFLRIGTFFEDTALPNELLGAGFIDAASRESVGLYYFDRACSVTGDYHEDDLVISFSLNIPGPGLYWMQTDSADPKHWQAKSVDPKSTLWYALIR